MSDDDLFEGEDSLGGASTSRGASTNSKRSRIPVNLEKQALTLVQAAGGIKIFDAGRPYGLQDLLDLSYNQGVFGEQGDPIRRKFSKRFDYLKSIKEEKYAQLLKKRGVKVTDADRKAVEAYKRGEKESRQAVTSDSEEQRKPAPKAKPAPKQSVAAAKTVPDTIDIPTDVPTYKRPRRTMSTPKSELFWVSLSLGFLPLPNLCLLTRQESIN